MRSASAHNTHDAVVPAALAASPSASAGVRPSEFDAFVFCARAGRRTKYYRPSLAPLATLQPAFKIILSAPRSVTSTARLKGAVFPGFNRGWERALSLALSRPRGTVVHRTSSRQPRSQDRRARRQVQGGESAAERRRTRARGRPPTRRRRRPPPPSLSAKKKKAAARMSIGYAELLAPRADVGGQLGAPEVHEPAASILEKMSQLAAMVGGLYFWRLGRSPSPSRAPARLPRQTTNAPRHPLPQKQTKHNHRADPRRQGRHRHGHSPRAPRATARSAPRRPRSCRSS